MPADPEPRRLCLVTGASAGIGAAFAREYASHGYDLALTARREDRLRGLADELGAKYGVETLVIPADLADPAAPDQIMGEITARGRWVSALVNNAGYGIPGGFSTSNWPEQAAMLQVMLTAVCALTRDVLPDMTRRKYGRVINVASLAGLIPGSPGHTLYGPVKAFLVRFSQSVHVETLRSGIHVTALCPGFTYSEFHDVNNTRKGLERFTPAWMWMSAADVAAAGYAAAEANRPVCVPGAPNKIIAGLCKVLPDDWVLSLMSHQLDKAPPRRDRPV